MSDSSPRAQGQFYFALPRLVAVIRGHNGARAERNWMEAYFGGVFVYAISYLFLASAVRVVAPVIAFAWAFVLAFATWIFWLIVVYLNSICVRVLRRVGTFRELTTARAQNILVGVETLLFALYLSCRPDWLRYAGFIATAAILTNLIASGVLALLNFASRDA